MAEIAVYSVDAINKALEIMDRDLTISGVQNIKALANIHEILTNQVEVKEVPDEEPAQEIGPMDGMPFPTEPTQANAFEMFNAEDNDINEVGEVVEGEATEIVEEAAEEVEAVEETSTEE